MDQFFTELGRGVLARWKAQNFSLAAFPQIAQSALESQPPAQHVDFDALVRDFLLADEQPFQSDSGFGQPELVVFDDPRFYIQILCWLEGTTDIHQHKFSGAFHVLAGSSIHSRYVFENAQSISAHLRIGQLRMTDTALLPTGSTVPIVSGRDYIHSLFHLETPSLTVVVRTHTDPGTGPQFTYLPPHLAVDPFHRDTLTLRRKQLLDVLEQTGDARYPALIAEMLATLDFERGFFILQNGMAGLQRLGAWEEAWNIFVQKHGALAEPVAPTLREIVRRDALVEMRASVTEPEHRFFLALLLNGLSREDLLAFVALRFSGDPIETILRWAGELASGSWLLDAEFPADVDVHPGDEPAAFLAALAASIGGSVPGAMQLAAADLESIREAFARSSLCSLLLPRAGRS